MTLPSFIFGVFVAALVGAMFHLWRGGNLGRLLLYLILSEVGFWIGQIVAGLSGLTFGSIGPLHLGASLLVCFIFLGFGYWLSLIQVENRG